MVEKGPNLNMSDAEVPAGAKTLDMLNPQVHLGSSRWGCLDGAKLFCIPGLVVSGGLVGIGTAALLNGMRWEQFTGETPLNGEEGFIAVGLALGLEAGLGVSTLLHLGLKGARDMLAKTLTF